MVEVAPNGRHDVDARYDARLLLNLPTSWPGTVHAGGLTLKQKANARVEAAKDRLAPSTRNQNQ
jgi:hypothetical protein